MTRPALRRFLIGAIAAPLAFGLAACGESAEDGASASVEPIAEIAAPDGKTWSEVVAKTEEGGYLMGNPDAPIKLVEFGALSCSHCATFAQASAPELKESFVNSGRVSFELRHFMLSPLDIAGTLLATCGSTEAVIPLSDQFWGWQSEMFKNMQGADQARLQAIDEMPPEKRFASLAEITGMTQFFASRGVSAAQGSVCLNDEAKVEALVNQTEHANEELDVTGTPTFMINGRKVNGNTWSAIKTELENMGAR
ncbi:MAG: thioredoxin domain-containing protein [Sphingomonadaceae bacterium]